MKATETTEYTDQSDAALERELERALAVDPSPEFQARVRLHIANEPAPSRWDWWWLAVITASAAAAVLAVIVVMWRPTARPEVVATNGTDTVLPLEVRPVAQPAPVQPPPARREPSIAQMAPRFEPAGHAESDDKVLIPAGEAAALRRLMRGLRTGRVDPSTLVEETAHPIAAFRLPNEIQLAPLAPLSSIMLEPLQSSAGEKGVRQ